VAARSARSVLTSRWMPRAAVPVIGALVLGLCAAVPTAAADRWAPPKPKQERSLAGHAVKAGPRKADPAEQRALRTAPKVTWPHAGTADAAIDATAGAMTRTGGLPVWVGAASRAARVGKGAVPGKVHIEVADRTASARAGVAGLLLRVDRADGVTGPGAARVEVDYSGFRYAYGGDWASRLRLVRLPDCALTTPDKAGCRTVRPVPSRNDATTGRVSADTELPGVFAVAAAPSGGTGDYKATSLAPSAQWQVTTQSGDFGWSYPLRMPPALGGPAPEVALSYSSGAIDGRTASTNNQSSWIGEGFDFQPGFIERKYKACADDDISTEPGDQCWGGENATLMLGGRSTDLIKDSSTGTWRLKNDNGMRVEALTNTTNADDNHEYWRVTSTDGTQYYFGLDRLPGWATGKPETKSTWTVPVFGDDAGEPCHGAVFADSWCQQAYRWNLAYVVDPHDNATSYFYETETNFYGRNKTATAGTPYVRGGYLDRIEYGQRDGSVYAGSAPSRVQFTVAERCIPDASFDCAESKLNATNAAHWPDVPFDRNCASGATCTNNFSPTFWTRKRLTKVTTQVFSGTAYTDVDSWALTQTFPDPGDGTSAGLWLEKIQHTGLVGGTASLPAVNLGGVQLVNRVDALEGIAPMVKWRVREVRSESGGTISVNYSGKECTRNAFPTPDSNAQRCFPQYWTPEGALEPQLDWFHKYVVTSVVEDDNLADRSPPVETSYTYVDTPAWHYDEDYLVPDERRTWSQWRGYSQVRVTEGSAGEQRSQSEHLFFRGMDGDKTSSGTRNVKITDSEGTPIDDHWRLQGFERESIDYNGPGGALVTAAINTAWLHGPTATNGAFTAYLLDTAKVRTRTTLADGSLRRTEVQQDFDDFGSVTEINDLGDNAAAGDDECTRYTYARNTTDWIVNLPSRVEKVAVACTATATRPDDVVSDVRTYYDGSTTLGAAPSRGDPTKVEEVADYTGGQPSYVQQARAVYDGYGRVTEAYDAKDHKTTTAYTPASGGHVTEVDTTNPLGHVTKTFMEPAWGAPVAQEDANTKRTDLEYDPLGRMAKVWLPGRAKANSTPNSEFTYQVTQSGASSITSKKLRNDGTYLISHELFDGLLRPRQTQAPAPDGGRLITDTVYDSRGEEVEKNDAYFNSDAPSTTLFTLDPGIAVPARTVQTYDGVGRLTAAIFQVNEQEKWRTTTTYGGDRVNVDPPQGGTATTTVQDARGRTTELRQYKGGAPTGAFDATTYTYAKGGQLATVTDPAGNVWRYHYDLRGRRWKADDPDKGTSTSVFDDLDQVTSTTDARGKTVAYDYDVLGRKIGMYEGSLSGTKLAEWAYDTLAKGQPTSSTRYVNGQPYTTAVVGYDSLYRPTGSKTTIPAAEGALAGTYQFSTAYNVDGTPQFLSMPAAGGLPSEAVRFSYTADLGLPRSTTSTVTPYVGNTIYNKFSLIEQQWEGNTGKGLNRYFEYDPGTLRLSRATTDRDSTTEIRQQDLFYAYDEAGNVTKIADKLPVSSAPQDVQCFRYDYLRRLTEAWAATDDCAGNPSLSVLGGAEPYWQSFTYDQTGNRLTQVRHSAVGDTTSTYTYPAPGGTRPHSLTGVTTTGPAGNRSDSYGYDEAGNTTSRTLGGTGQTLEWDTEGRLAKVTKGSEVTSFIYDADGNRLLRKDPTGTTLYLGAMELRLDSGTTTVKGTRYYSHAGRVVAVRTSDGKLTWLVDDHLGTAGLSIAEDTLAVTRRRITPFGEVRGQQPTWPGERGFVGGTIDASTGLTHLGAREYDPAAGRFVSVDPVIDPSDPQQMNGYAYAGNTPVTSSDPDGRCPADRCGIGVPKGAIAGKSSGVIKTGPVDPGNPNGGFVRNGRPQRIVRRSLTTPEERAAEEAAKQRLAEQRLRNEIAELIAQSRIGHDDGTVPLACSNGVCADWGDDTLSALIWEYFDLGTVNQCLSGDKASCLPALINIAMRFKMHGVKPCNSFVPGTDVLMADGKRKPIEKIKVGDKVLAADPKTGKTQAKKVVAAFGGSSYDHLVQITVDTDGKHGHKTGVVIATEHHLFWDQATKQWVRADQLGRDDKLRTPKSLSFEVVRAAPYPGHPGVRDLTIAGTHTFYVLAGETPVLVHNSLPCGPTYENPGHHDPTGGPNAYIPNKAVLPDDAAEQFANSILVGDTRWTKIGSGKKAVYYRYFQHGDNVWHWSGSTSGVTKSGESVPIPLNRVPIEIRRG
jgi:RHS repeat-associated protein